MATSVFPSPRYMPSFLSRVEFSAPTFSFLCSSICIELLSLKRSSGQRAAIVSFLSSFFSSELPIGLFLRFGRTQYHVRTRCHTDYRSQYQMGSGYAAVRYVFGFYKCWTFSCAALFFICLCFDTWCLLCDIWYLVFAMLTPVFDGAFPLFLFFLCVMYDIMHRWSTSPCWPLYKLLIVLRGVADLLRSTYLMWEQHI